MTKRVLLLIALALMALFALSACAPAATPVPTAAPPTSAPLPTNPPPPTTAPPTTAPPSAKALKVGVVSDTGGVNDKSFNQSAVKGMTDAKAQLGLDPASKFLESRQQSDYAKNIEEFTNSGFDMIVTVGFLMGVDTAKEAKASPNVKFAIVDYAYPDCFGTQTEGKDCGSAKPLANVEGLTFQTDQAAFQAGYLAAAVSHTKKVGTFGGLNIPTVTIFMVGFEGGVKYWNQKHNDKVQVLGWNTAKNDGTFAAGSNPFQDPDKGAQITNSLIDSGADIVMPVAGGTGLGTFTVAKQKKILAIGVDADQCISVPDACSVLLTSVRKNIDVAVFSAIKSVKDGTFKGGTNYVGTLANDGVSIAPFHEQETMVKGVMGGTIQAELDQIKADIIAGKIDVTAIAKGP